MDVNLVTASSVAIVGNGDVIIGGKTFTIFDFASASAIAQTNGIGFDGTGTNFLRFAIRWSRMTSRPFDINTRFRLGILIDPVRTSILPVPSNLQNAIAGDSGLAGGSQFQIVQRNTVTTATDVWQSGGNAVVISSATGSLETSNVGAHPKAMIMFDGNDADSAIYTGDTWQTDPALIGACVGQIPGRGVPSFTLENPPPDVPCLTSDPWILICRWQNGPFRAVFQRIALQLFY